MNYNPRMGFNEQDYHLLKTHQSSGGSSIKQELFKNISWIEFDDQHNYMFDIVCDCYLTPSGTSVIPSFSGSSGCNIVKKTNPTNVDTVSHMVITIATNNETGTKGQIFWNGGIYDITCTSGTSWTINLPSDNYYFYNGVKTEMGDPGELL